jgi:hypothetical protein
MKMLPFVAAAALAAAAPALAQEPRGAVLVAPTGMLNYPQGAPDYLSGAGLRPLLQLRFAIEHGRRVLYDPQSGEVVYVLQP